MELLHECGSALVVVKTEDERGKGELPLESSSNVALRKENQDSKTDSLSENTNNISIVAGAPCDVTSSLEKDGSIQWILLLSGAFHEITDRRARYMEIELSTSEETPDTSARDSHGDSMFGIAVSQYDGYAIILISKRGYINESDSIRIVKNMNDILHFEFGPAQWWLAKNGCDYQVQSEVQSFMDQMYQYTKRDHLCHSPNGILESEEYFTDSFTLMRDRIVPTMSFNNCNPDTAFDARLRLLSALTEAEVATASVEHRAIFQESFQDVKQGCIIIGERVAATHLNPDATWKVYNHCKRSGLLSRHVGDPQKITIGNVFLPLLSSHSPAEIIASTNLEQCILMTVGRGAYLTCLILRACHILSRDDRYSLKFGNLQKYIKKSHELAAAVAATERLRSDTTLSSIVDNYNKEFIEGYNKTIPPESGITISDLHTGSIEEAWRSNGHLAKIPLFIPHTLHDVCGLLLSFREASVKGTALGKSIYKYSKSSNNQDDITFSGLVVSNFGGEDQDEASRSNTPEMLSDAVHPEDDFSEDLDNIMEMSLNDLSKVSNGNFVIQPKSLHDSYDYNDVDVDIKSALLLSMSSADGDPCPLELSISLHDINDAEKGWRITSRSEQATSFIEYGSFYRTRSNVAARTAKEYLKSHSIETRAAVFEVMK